MYHSLTETERDELLRMLVFPALQDEKSWGMAWHGTLVVFFLPLRSEKTRRLDAVHTSLIYTITLFIASSFFSCSFLSRTSKLNGSNTVFFNRSVPQEFNEPFDEPLRKVDTLPFDYNKERSISKVSDKNANDSTLERCRRQL